MAWSTNLHRSEIVAVFPGPVLACEGYGQNYCIQKYQIISLMPIICVTRTHVIFTFGVNIMLDNAPDVQTGRVSFSLHFKPFIINMGLHVL